MRLKLLAVLAGLGLAIGGAAALAEDEISQTVFMDGPGIAQPLKGGITAEQRKALYPPRGPRPGIYRMRALHSGLCVVAWEPNDGFDRQARLAQFDCAALDASANPQRFYEFVMLPHPSGGYTVRSQLAVNGGRAAVPGQISNCLTVAPGAVFGPARIELRGCEVPGGTGWDQAGGEGQRFDVLQMAADAWEIRPVGASAENPDCIAVRGASRESRADYVKWGCNGNADQRLMVEWVRPIPADLERAALARSKWHPFADGHYRLSPANGVDLTGASYTSFETIDDNGDYCMRRCAELAECKAWTWTGPGYVGNDPPKCYWKHGAGNPVNRGPRSLGKLYSGIVRM